MLVLLPPTRPGTLFVPSLFPRTRHDSERYERTIRKEDTVATLAEIHTIPEGICLGSVTTDAFSWNFFSGINKGNPRQANQYTLQATMQGFAYGFESSVF